MKQEMNTELKKYLNSLFGKDFTIQDYNFTNSVPLYLDDGYRFQMVRIQGTSFIAMEPTTKEYRLPTLVKHLAKASQLSGLDCALVFSSLRSSQRSALLQQRVPFLVPGAQLYLPFVGCAFTEKKTNTLCLPEAMAPGTQLVFLYVYYRKTSTPVTASELATQLKLSKATLTRAVRTLKQLGLISIQLEGTKKLLTTAITPKRNLLDAAKPYLKSPVHQTIYLSSQPKKSFLGGILALSSQTMLSANKKDGSYVVSRSRAKEIESDKISEQDFLDFGGFPVELWKYDPALLSSGKTVDSISLILSFNQDYDERTEQALQSVKENISW
jgi:DNA-binding transcriptional ArsR family regulator